MRSVTSLTYTRELMDSVLRTLLSHILRQANVMYVSFPFSVRSYFESESSEFVIVLLNNRK